MRSFRVEKIRIELHREIELKQKLYCGQLFNLIAQNDNQTRPINFTPCKVWSLAKIWLHLREKSPLSFEAKHSDRFGLSEAIAKS